MNNYYNYQNYFEQAKQNMNQTAMPKDESQNMAMQNMMPEQAINPYAQNIVPKKGDSSTQRKLYDPYQGFIRGNMFPALYDPYKVNVPYEIKPMNEQAEMLTNIDALGFAMIDLNLYLDLHQNDREAIDAYNQFRMNQQEIQKKYESKFGPLVLTSDALNNYPWMWDNQPWPWEKQ